MCTKAGATSRVQCHGAPTDMLASYALVDIPESETLLFDPDFLLLAASAAAFHDKPIVSSETFSCIYGSVSTSQTPPGLGEELVDDLRCVADAQLVWGVNRVVWNGKPFGTEEDRKRFYVSDLLGGNCYLFIAHLKIRMRIRFRKAVDHLKMFGIGVFRGTRE